MISGDKLYYAEEEEQEEDDVQKVRRYAEILRIDTQRFLEPLRNTGPSPTELSAAKSGLRLHRWVNVFKVAHDGFLKTAPAAKS